MVLGKRIVGYFAGWSIYGRNYQPTDIPAAKLTHVNYAFANVDASGHVLLGDPYGDVEKVYPGDNAGKQPFCGALNQLLNKVRPANPGLKVLLSVGGWTWSGNFSAVARTESGRVAFADSVKSMVDKYGFDGVDVDWEYPVEGGLAGIDHSSDDGKNYVLLLQKVRQALGADKLITIAVPAMPSIAQHLDMAAIAKVVDFVNVMTYDFRGSWSSYTGHSAQLYTSPTDPDPVGRSLSVNSTMNWYLSNGMPADKINMGMPLYGRGWEGIKMSNATPAQFQKYKSIPRGTWDKATGKPEGVFDYADVLKRIKKKVLMSEWDSDAHTAWAHSSSSDLMISYESVQSAQEKTQYLVDHGLGGIMFWDLSGDDRTSDSLVDVVHAKLS